MHVHVEARPSAWVVMGLAASRRCAVPLSSSGSHCLPWCPAHFRAYAVGLACFPGSPRGLGQGSKTHAHSLEL